LTAGYSITAVSGIDCGLADQSWSFAQQHAGAIDLHWAERCRAKPELFNGRVLLLWEGSIETVGKASVLRGSFIESDFKSFLFWRDRGFPPTDVRNCFAMAALETADGAFVLGEMAPHTAPAGQIYFPSGTPDPQDVVNGQVDIDGSARRELAEETGLGSGDVVFEEGLVLVSNATRVCCMKPVRSPATAEVLVARIHAWLARDPKPELARMHVVRSLADLVPAMPDFIKAYLTHKLA
jgi:8-oxo-dGTP pyrophosphatase MutT (NUDIX family)